MYDGSKIITGVVILLALITFPTWYTLASGGKYDLPEPKIVTEEEQCIESKQYMRENHMNLLLDWRETVVRDDIRTYVASDGREYEISLSGTCMDCHSNKADFCDQCHNSVLVQPDCWTCHNEPEES